MMLFSIVLASTITASALDQPQASVEIESLLKDSSNTITAAPASAGNGQTVTIPPMTSDIASIGNVLGAPGTASVNPQKQPQINQSPSNVGATGQLMDSLLDSSTDQHSFQGASEAKTPVSEESRMIVSGMVEAFMHKQHLLPGEKTCLEDSVSQLTGDVVGTGKDVIDAVRGLVKMNKPAGAPAVTSQTQTKSQGTVVSSGIDAALKLTSLVTLATSLVKNCVHGDALRMLKEAGHHLIDMKYLGHRLVVSGVDIAHCLSDSIISYEKHHYHRFGVDIGTSLRKVLLSNSSRGAQLPEGVPEEAIIQKTTEGLMDGFFVGGSSMEITDSARPDVDIRLDLHRCVAGNQQFFKEIFMSIWNAIAQFSVNGEQHGLGSSEEGGNPKWTGELMIALMQLPSALQRCNIDAETQGMFMESIQTLGQVKVHMDFPKGEATMKEISGRMAKAVKQWTGWHFKSFGEELGVMLREFMLMVYPMKYSVDQSGRLRRELSSIKARDRSIAPGFLALALVGVTLAVLMGFAVIRGMRSRMHAQSTEKMEIDAELAADQLLNDQELIE